MIIKNCKSCQQAFVSDHSEFCIMCMMQNSVLKKELEVLNSKNRQKTNLAKNLSPANQNHKVNQQNKTKLSKKDKKLKEEVRHLSKVKCILCGELIEPRRGAMAEHKNKAHGETLYKSSPIGKAKVNSWVKIYQGGLPGLGKKYS